MKTCTKCGETKPVTEFSKHSGRRDGLQCSCKACIATYNAENKEKVAAKKSVYYAENTERILARNAVYKAKNTEKVAARNAVYYAANPEAHRIHEHNRRARKRANGGKLSKGLADKLFKLQRGKCACCRVNIADGNHLDHVIPVATGGPNEDWNMQLLCGLCNRQKGAKHPVEFMQQRGFLL